MAALSSSPWKRLGLEGRRHWEKLGLGGPLLSSSIEKLGGGGTIVGARDRGSHHHKRIAVIIVDTE